MAILKESKKYIVILLIVLTLACVVFIFSNSLNNGEDSGRQSGRVVRAVLKIAGFFGIEVRDTAALSHFVRKSAHFLEFALLGALSVLTLKSVGLCRIAQVYFATSFCLLIAACDEYIQTFSSGRSGQVSDVFLDLSGSITAIAICLIICLLIRKRIKKANTYPGEYNNKGNS